MIISSVGLTRQFHENVVLGKYEYDGDSNGRPSYKGPGGKYLQFSPGGEWMVSIITQNSINVIRQYEITQNSNTISNVSFVLF